MSQDLKNKSKFLSLILRHKPEDHGITLDKEGWAPVDDLIQKCHFSLDELKKIVITDNKERYTFNSDFTKIRANQGHSIPVDLKLDTITPPPFLYHGTVAQSIEAIKKNGLAKMKRQYVHLSADEKTAAKVARRRGRPIIIQIKARTMMMDGYKFYVSKNGVYLTDCVPSKYFSSIDELIK